MNCLFVCSMNQLRSPTAEAVFANYEGLRTLSAGTLPDAKTPMSADLIEWADVILVMENSHRNRLNRQFGSLLKDKRLVVLGIPDNYGYMEPALVEELKRKVPPLLQLPSSGHQS